MNNWSFTGNLGGDAETRFLTNGDAVVQFSVGVKSGYGEKAKTVWARCAMFGKRGQAVSEYLTKGQLVGVCGEVSVNEFTSKDGTARFSLEVRVNDLTLLGKKDGQHQQHQRQEPSRQQPSQSAPPQYQQNGSWFDSMGDDIPF